MRSVDYSIRLAEQFQADTCINKGKPMFIVLLKFSENKGQAGEHMPGHNRWLKQGFDDGVFALAGSLQPGLGGGIVAHSISREDLEARVNDDPFVTHGVVSPEILEFTPAKADDRLQFLVE